MTGAAFEIKAAIAALVQQHGLTEPPFTPLPLGPELNHDITLEGYAAPATIDREHTRLAANCWTPFKATIPRLYRHASDQPAGQLEEIRVDDRGLYVRARVSHIEARRCPYWSVCATLHSWRIVTGDRPHAEITSATLDEVSLVPSSPGNADAIARRRGSVRLS